MYREPDFSQPRFAAAPECRFEPAPADTVLPDGFMSTTNHPTYVKVGGRWRMPERPRMDSHLVWDPAAERLVIKEFRLVRQGDLVAVASAEDGSEGVFVWDRGFQDEVDETEVAEAFSFMASEVSREKPVNYDAIFREFVRLPHPDIGRTEGTGLGLAISSRLARLLGGDLTVDSEVGVRSTFALYLPCPAPALES